MKVCVGGGETASSRGKAGPLLCSGLRLKGGTRRPELNPRTQVKVSFVLSHSQAVWPQAGSYTSLNIHIRVVKGEKKECVSGGLPSSDSRP